MYSNILCMYRIKTNHRFCFYTVCVLLLHTVYHRISNNTVY